MSGPAGRAATSRPGCLVLSARQREGTAARLAWYARAAPLGPCLVLARLRPRAWLLGLWARVVCAGRCAPSRVWCARLGAPSSGTAWPAWCARQRPHCAGPGLWCARPCACGGSATSARCARQRWALAARLAWCARGDSANRPMRVAPCARRGAAAGSLAACGPVRASGRRCLPARREGRAALDVDGSARVVRARRGAAAWPLGARGPV